MHETNLGQTPGFLKRLWLSLRDTAWKNLIAPLSFSNNPPWFDARGVAIGLLVALGLPIGGHTAVLGLLLLLVKFNFPVAFAVTWVVNPFTVIPLYYGYYVAGCFLLGDSPSMGMEGFREIMAPVLNADNFVQALKLFLLSDLRILERWMAAAAVFSIAAAAAGYVAAYALFAKRKTSHSPANS